LVLVGSSSIVYPARSPWTPSMGTDGTIYVDGKRYLASKSLPAFSELTHVVLMADMSNVDSERRGALFMGLGGLLVAVLVASLVSVLVSRGISRPVEQLVDAAHKIAAGDYKVKVDVASSDEIGRLGGAFNDMTDGLRKRQEIMEKTLSPDVAEEFLKGTDRRPERRIVTIVFMDIRGYTNN